MLTLPVGLFPIWVSWPLARGSFAYCLSRLLFFLLFSVVYYNLEHPDKNRVLKFWCIFARGIGQWFPASPIVLTLPVGLLPRRVSWPHAWGSIAYLGCQKIFTCETRVLHSTPQSLTYWLRRLPFFLMHAQACLRRAHARKATGAHRPLPREKNLYLFSSFFTYTSKYQNVTRFFWLDVPKDSHVVLWSKCLKTAEKSSQSVVAVFPHLINSARSYMTFLPHNVPQSIILIRLDVTSSFRKRLVSTNESSETNFRLFQVATKTGNEDEERKTEKVGEGRHCSFDSLLCFCYELFGLVVHSIVPISVA